MLLPIRVISPALSGRSRGSVRHGHRKITPLRSRQGRYGVTSPHFPHSRLSGRHRSVSSHSRTSNPSRSKLRRHGSTRSQLTAKTDRGSTAGSRKKEVLRKLSGGAGEAASLRSKGGRGGEGGGGYGVSSSTSTPSRRLEASPGWSKSGQRREREEHLFPSSGTSSSTRHNSHLKMSKDVRLKSGPFFDSRKSSSNYHVGGSTAACDSGGLKKNSRILSQDYERRDGEDDLSERGVSGRVFSVPASDVREDENSKNDASSSWWGRWTEAVTTPSPQRSKGRGVLTRGMSSSSSQLGRHQHAENVSRGDCLVRRTPGDSGSFPEGESESPDVLGHQRRTLGSFARPSLHKEDPHHVGSGDHNDGSAVGEGGPRESERHPANSSKRMLARRSGKGGEVLLSPVGSPSDSAFFLGEAADGRRKSGDFHAVVPSSPSSHGGGSSALGLGSLRQEERGMSLVSSARSSQVSASNLSPPVSLRSRHEQLQPQQQGQVSDRLRRRPTDERRRIATTRSGDKSGGDTSHPTSAQAGVGRGSTSSLRTVEEANVLSPPDLSIVSPGRSKEGDAHSLVDALGGLPGRKPQGSRSLKGDKITSRLLSGNRSAGKSPGQEADTPNIVSTWVDTLASSLTGYDDAKGEDGVVEGLRKSGRVGVERKLASLRQDERVRTAEAALFTPPGPRSPLNAGAAVAGQRSRGTASSSFSETGSADPFSGSLKPQARRKEDETEDRESWIRRARTSDAQRQRQGREEKHLKSEDKGAAAISRVGDGSVASTPAESSRSELAQRRQIRLSHRSRGFFEAGGGSDEALRSLPPSSSMSTSSGRAGRKAGEREQERAFLTSASSLSGRTQGQSKLSVLHRGAAPDEDEESERGNWSEEKRRFFSKKSSSEEDRDAPGLSGSPRGRTRRGDSHSSSSNSSASKTHQSSRRAGGGGEREAGRNASGGGRRTTTGARSGESADVRDGLEDSGTRRSVSSLPNQDTHRSDRLSTHRSKDSSTDVSARGYGPNSSRSQGSTHLSSFRSSERFSASSSLQSSLELSLPPLGKLGGPYEPSNVSIDLSDAASSPVSTTAPSSASSGTRHRVGSKKLVNSVVRSAMGPL